MDEDEKLEQYWKYIEQNYPGAFSVINLIHNNFTEIYEDVFNVSLEDDKPKRISFFMQKNSFGKPTMMVTKDSMIFLTALSESILQLVVGLVRPDADVKKIEFDLKSDNKDMPKSMQEDSTNMCSGCGHVNNIEHVYCSKCGNKLL